MSVGAPASFDPEKADNLEDVRHSLPCTLEVVSHVRLNVTDSFAA